MPADAGFGSGRRNGVDKVLGICQTETINRLLDIADEKNIVAVAKRPGLRLDAVPGEQLENIILLSVGILVFVDHDELVIRL